MFQLRLRALPKKIDNLNKIYFYSYCKIIWSWGEVNIISLGGTHTHTSSSIMILKKIYK